MRKNFKNPCNLLRKVVVEWGILPAWENQAIFKLGKQHVQTLKYIFLESVLLGQQDGVVHFRPSVHPSSHTDQKSVGSSLQDLEPCVGFGQNPQNRIPRPRKPIGRRRFGWSICQDGGARGPTKIQNGGQDGGQL